MLLTIKPCHIYFPYFPISQDGALRKLHLHLYCHLKEVRIVALPYFLYNMRLEECVATTVCVNKFPLILLILSSLRNENENKIYQNSSVNTKYQAFE